MGLQDVIAIAVALGALAFTARFLWRSMKGDQGCSSCPTAVSAKRKIETPQLKRTPLVSLETSTIKKSAE